VPTLAPFAGELTVTTGVVAKAKAEEHRRMGRVLK
jgi:hypothetical protein